MKKEFEHDRKDKRKKTKEGIFYPCWYRQ